MCCGRGEGLTGTLALGFRVVQLRARLGQNAVEAPDVGRFGVGPDVEPCGTRDRARGIPWAVF